jgi:hypothetical protein
MQCRVQGRLLMRIGAREFARHPSGATDIQPERQRSVIVATKKESGDLPVLSHIEELVNEERKLHEASATGPVDTARLEKVKVELDQAWDLLRQRRAQREFGRNPDDAHVRPADVVEKYEN